MVHTANRPLSGLELGNILLQPHDVTQALQENANPKNNTNHNLKPNPNPNPTAYPNGIHDALKCSRPAGNAATTTATEYAECTKVQPTINALKRGRPLVGI